MMSQAIGGWRDEILETLDQFAKDFLFPMPNNANFQLARMRLTTFRSDSEWLIIFEEIAYSESSSDRFANYIHAYGNQLEESYSDPIQPFIFDEQGNSLWDENGRFQIKSEGTIIQLNGQLKNVTRDMVNQPEIEPLVFLRTLTETYPKDVFLSNSKLLTLVDRTKSNLNLFVKWDDWHHPDLADDELLSETACFQNLAKALEINNPDIATCPSDEWNTHWKNWHNFK